MIIANITSYRGQDCDAVHYYCCYEEVAEMKPKLTYSGGWNNELTRVISEQKEADYINKKDGYNSYEIGTETNRFNSFDEIHMSLIKMFGDQTIITYYENQVFSEMLYWVNGVNLTYKEFGDIWVTLPRSCYKDLLPDISTIKVKCDNCGHVYTWDEIQSEREWDGRTLIKFNDKRNMDEVCCKYFDLIWNVIL